MMHCRDSIGSSAWGYWGRPFPWGSLAPSPSLLSVEAIRHIVLGQNSTVALHCSITHHTIVISSLQLRMMYEREGVICEAQGPPEELILVH